MSFNNLLKQWMVFILFTAFNIISSSFVITMTEKMLAPFQNVWFTVSVLSNLIYIQVMYGLNYNLLSGGGIDSQQVTTVHAGRLSSWRRHKSSIPHHSALR